MEPKDNPYLKIDNPYEGVKNVRDEMNKEQLELMRLCHEVFHVEPKGKELMKIFRERYLSAALFRPDHPQCKELALYWEGFREAIRGFYNLGLQHQQYINGVQSNGRQPNTTSSTTI